LLGYPESDVETVPIGGQPAGSGQWCGSDLTRAFCDADQGTWRQIEADDLRIARGQGRAPGVHRVRQVPTHSCSKSHAERTWNGSRLSWEPTFGTDAGARTPSLLLAFPTKADVEAADPFADVTSPIEWGRSFVDAPEGRQPSGDCVLLERPSLFRLLRDGPGVGRNGSLEELTRLVPHQNLAWSRLVASPK
jgi:hypothetical protein